MDTPREIPYVMDSPEGESLCNGPPHRESLCDGPPHIENPYVMDSRKSETSYCLKKGILTYWTCHIENPYVMDSQIQRILVYCTHMAGKQYLFHCFNEGIHNGLPI